jgi:hypothetical protein
LAMDRCKDAEPWVRFALEQARLVVKHLEHERPKRRFVREHALMLMQVADGGTEADNLGQLLREIPMHAA